MTDDRTETITDPAAIRATDEPDERGDFPCCTTPAPSSGAGPDLGALHETICDNFTGMAEVRQAADLLVAEVRRLVKYRDWWKASSLANAEDVRRLTAICHDWRDRSEAAEAEVVTLRAKLGHGMNPIAPTRKDIPMTDTQPTGQIPDDAGLTPRECPHHFDCDGIRCDPGVSDVPSSAPAHVELEETITDPAAIRATDEPDERTTPAPVGAAVALDLDAARAMLNAANTIKATGGAVEIGGVRIEPCDEYGSTVTTARAESAEAEAIAAGKAVVMSAEAQRVEATR